jgi:hypothetical protein
MIFVLRLLPFLFLLLWPLRGVAQEWSRICWNDEPAWQSECRGWKAVVSVARGRLVFWGRSGGENILYVSRKAEPLNTSDPNPPSWGGHRVWLGPQSLWNSGWPPPRSWEYAPAQKVGVGEGKLSLGVAATGVFPGWIRSYVWKEGALQNSVEWDGASRALYAFQVFALRPEVCARVNAPVSAQLPKGMALLPIWERPGVRRQFDLPLACVTRKGDVVIVNVTKQRQRIGVPAVDIDCLSPWGNFSVRRLAEGEGIPAEDGLETQIYAGDANSFFLEVEQLSLLMKSRHGPARFTVVLRPD